MALSRRERRSPLDPQTRRDFYDLHALLCKALADPKRLLIINALRDQPKTVGELTAELELSQSNTSQHLSILRDRGVVRATRRGNNVAYSLRDMRVLEAVDLFRAVTAASPGEDSPIRRSVPAPRRRS
ncbi:MAG TPA: metalloregulator ArsR/SmtB family transcription factor [Actinomycetota bacterium]